MITKDQFDQGHPTGIIKATQKIIGTRKMTFTGISKKLLGLAWIVKRTEFKAKQRKHGDDTG